jgi:hypothetical protein
MKGRHQPVSNKERGDILAFARLNIELLLLPCLAAAKAGRGRRRFMNGESILVIGAAGFIGFHVAQRLAESGRDVIGIDNLTT